MRQGRQGLPNLLQPNGVYRTAYDPGMLRQYIDDITPGIDQH